MSEKKRTELRGRNLPDPPDETALLDGIGDRQTSTGSTSSKMIKPVARRSSGKFGWKALWRDLRLRWRLWGTTTRVVAGTLLVATLLHLFLATADWLYARPRNWPPQILEQQFAVVINTYKRPDMLRQAVQHYAQTCGPAVGVSQVFVIWAELDVTPPAPSTWLKPKTRGGGRQTSSVEIIQVAVDSLNSRFLPIKNIQSSAVFMVDDDVRVDCSSLRQGFAAWRTNPDAMVGYYPRLALESKHKSKNNNEPQAHIYQAWPGVYYRQAANFMLTKASFLHHKYMEMYSNPSIHPTEILKYVDEYKNCEDVAMSLLVANVTASSSNPNTSKHLPNILYVEAHVSDMGLFGGISSSGKTQHFAHRSDCLRDMSAMYVQHGWPKPLSQLRYKLPAITWQRHILPYQIRPSNFFEWFALTNMFQS